MNRVDMNCDELLSLLGQLIDHEVVGDEAVRANEHLGRCATCRAAYEDLMMWDGQLRQRLAPQGAERTVAAVTSSIARATPAESPAGAPGASRRSWFVAAICAAAAVLLVVFAWPSKTPEKRPQVAAQVTLATGAIEYQAPAGDWQLLRVSGPLPMVDGSRLRTVEQSLCEIQTTNQGTLRLNNASELIIHDSEHVELVQGQVWCRAPSEALLKVELPLFVCPVDAGKAVMVDANKPEPTTVNGGVDVSAILWQLPLLHREGAISGELDKMLESLLARIGQTKASYMYERQIRALGVPGAAPLLAYVRSDRSLAVPDKRRWSMRIASEMADASLLSQLEQLSSDDDEQVRQYAVTAIARINEQQQQ